MFVGGLNTSITAFQNFFFIKYFEFEKLFGFSAKSTIAQIYRELEQMRPQLFRLTSETEDNNDELMVILRLTDEVNRIINLCKDKHPDIINMQR